MVDRPAACKDLYQQRLNAQTAWGFTGNPTAGASYGGNVAAVAMAASAAAGNPASAVAMAAHSAQYMQHFAAAFAAGKHSSSTSSYSVGPSLSSNSERMHYQTDMYRQPQPAHMPSNRFNQESYAPNPYGSSLHYPGYGANTYGDPRGYLPNGRQQQPSQILGTYTSPSVNYAPPAHHSSVQPLARSEINKVSHLPYHHPSLMLNEATQGFGDNQTPRGVVDSRSTYTNNLNSTKPSATNTKCKSSKTNRNVYSKTSVSTAFLHRSNSATMLNSTMVASLPLSNTNALFSTVGSSHQPSITTTASFFNRSNNIAPVTYVNTCNASVSYITPSPGSGPAGSGSIDEIAADIFRCYESKFSPHLMREMHKITSQMALPSNSTTTLPSNSTTALSSNSTTALTFNSTTALPSNSTTALLPPNSSLIITTLGGNGNIPVSTQSSINQTNLSKVVKEREKNPVHSEWTQNNFRACQIVTNTGVNCKSFSSTQDIIMTTNASIMAVTTTTGVNLALLNVNTTDSSVYANKFKCCVTTQSVVNIAATAVTVTKITGSPKKVTISNSMSSGMSSVDVFPTKSFEVQTCSSPSKSFGRLFLPGSKNPSSEVKSTHRKRFRCLTSCESVPFSSSNGNSGSRCSTNNNTSVTDPYAFEDEDDGQKCDSLFTNTEVTAHSGPVYTLKHTPIVTDSCDSETEDSPSKVRGRKCLGLNDHKLISPKKRSATDASLETTEAKHSRLNQDKKVCKSVIRKGGGTLWAMPILPKLPQKQNINNSKSIPSAVKDEPITSQSNPQISDVWRQAFGAVTPKSKAKAKDLNEGFFTNTRICPNQKLTSTPSPCSPLRRHRTVLDVPPEVRRRPRPPYGGLLHFSPDWERAVSDHHRRTCHLPLKLCGLIKTMPRILCDVTKAETLLNEVQAQTPLVISPSRKDTTIRGRISPLIHDTVFENAMLQDSEGFDGCSAMVHAILQNRKNIRMKLGRMFRLPFMKEIARKMNRKLSSGVAESDSVVTGDLLLPTPGLPIPPLVSDASVTKSHLEVLEANMYNFRRNTLLDYIEGMANGAELRAKLLENKATYRSSNYREIFGLEIPVRKWNKKIKAGAKKTLKVKKQCSHLRDSQTDLVKSNPRNKHQLKELRKQEGGSYDEATKSVKVEEEDEDEEVPSKFDQNLQKKLQSIALELLESNVSWIHKTVIQNLVIWEPIDPQLTLPASVGGGSEKKPGRKKCRKQKRQSGLDFINSNKRQPLNKVVPNTTAVSSKPLEPEEIRYSLDNVMTETKSWVVDRGAGESILHRAAKMGYGDVAVYALTILKMSVHARDNAGIPPIHKAAFKGHGGLVHLLLRLGANPNDNVKGTRPLHEALEGGSLDAVFHLLSYGADPLLYDYSGNMPIDLTEGDACMKRYFSAVLSDLHGQYSERWERKDTYTASPESTQPDEDENSFDFEETSFPLPASYVIGEERHEFYIVSDLVKLRGSGFSHDNLRLRCDIVEMSKDKFLQFAHCQLLGAPCPSVAVSNSCATISLVRVNRALKKILNITTLPIDSL